MIYVNYRVSDKILLNSKIVMQCYVELGKHNNIRDIHHVMRVITPSVQKTVRIRSEDWEILTKKKISFDQNFVHTCVMQLDVERKDIEMIPKFIFNGNADNEELYQYLKNNPEAAEFIYGKLVMSSTQIQSRKIIR